MTTLEFLRTHRTVVERIRRASEREFTGLAALETAVAVELLTTDERMDISSQYSAASSSLNPAPMREVAVLRESNVAECGPGPHRSSQEALACDILHRVPLFELELS
jgi:hypothetical protein